MEFFETLWKGVEKSQNKFFETLWKNLSLFSNKLAFLKYYMNDILKNDSYGNTGHSPMCLQIPLAYIYHISQSRAFEKMALFQFPLSKYRVLCLFYVLLRLNA